MCIRLICPYLIPPCSEDGVNLFGGEILNSISSDLDDEVSVSSDKSMRYRWCMRAAYLYYALSPFLSPCAVFPALNF
jgi:hypothetical protein